MTGPRRFDGPGGVDAGDEVAPPARLRGPLRWVLAAALLAAAASLIWPARGVVDVQHGNDGTDAVVREAAPRQTSNPVAERPWPGVSAGGIANLQPRREADTTPASPTFDPFVGLVPPPVVAPAPQQRPAEAPPPAPPPQEYRYLGRITGPDGVEQVLLVHGDSVVPVARGTALDNGYVVESLSQDAVVLTYPLLGIRSNIPIPSASIVQR